MPNQAPSHQPQPSRSHRGAALLAFAGPPAPEVLATMTACAANLDRQLDVATAGVRPGGVIAVDAEIDQIAAVVRRRAIAVVVVASATAARIVRRLAIRTRRPVLVARTRQRWQLVLAATDLCARGVPVVTVATGLASVSGAAALVLHNVAPTWAAPSRSIRPLASASVARQLRRLARVAARTSPHPQVMVASTVEPARAIVDAMVARDADLLVVGMRRPRPRRPGGCAERVVSTTPGNVLVVPLGASVRSGAGGGP